MPRVEWCGRKTKPKERTRVEMKVPGVVMEGSWNTGGDGKHAMPNLHLVWTGIAADRVEAILRLALDREELEDSGFWNGLTASDKKALKEGRSLMDENSLDE